MARLPKDPAFRPRNALTSAEAWGSARLLLALLWRSLVWFPVMLARLALLVLAVRFGAQGLVHALDAMWAMALSDAAIAALCAALFLPLKPSSSRKAALPSENESRILF